MRIFGDHRIIARFRAGDRMTSRPTSAEHPNAVTSVPQSAPPTNVPDTTGTFPAPRPEILPYRPPIDLAVERVGSDGLPISPSQPPVVYRHKGNRHPPLAPPGTPKIHDQITVTPPPATTTTQAPETPQPPTGTQR